MAKNWKSIENDKEKYAAYLCSREWAEKREAVRERAGNRCERCRVLPMDACHHLTYERKYREDLDDLQATCKPCHEFTHGKSSFDPTLCLPWLRYLMSCKKNGKNAVCGLLAVANEPPTTFQEGASLIAIESIYERFLTLDRCLMDFCGGADPNSPGYRVLNEFEVIPDRVETLLGIDCSFAAWLRFGKPSVWPTWYHHTLEIVGVESGQLDEWPDVQE